jgi:hypothetical protein
MIGQLAGWIEKIGFKFVRSIPRTKPFQPLTGTENLFEPETLGNPLERFLVETGMILRGGREGGFFTVIGRKE